MEGRIEIVVEKVFKIEKVFKFFKIEKVFKIIAQYFDLIATNQIDSCALCFWWHMTQHMTCPIALYKNTAGNGHQMSFKRLKYYLSGVTFEVISQKPQQITQHIDIRGKKRATYMPCKLQLVGSVHRSRAQMT